jgi:hypothetical protein
MICHSVLNYLLYATGVALPRVGHTITLYLRYMQFAQENHTEEPLAAPDNDMPCHAFFDHNGIKILVIQIDGTKHTPVHVLPVVLNNDNLVCCPAFS